MRRSATRISTRSLCAALRPNAGMNATELIWNTLIIAASADVPSPATTTLMKRLKAKNSKNSTLRACQTISVVMSPNALQAPPAFAATTRLMKASVTKRTLSRPTARITPDMISEVVRLSSTADMKKEITPVSQNSAR